MAQILLDLFSDFSDFYPTFLFKIGSQTTCTQAQGSLARGNCGNPWTREEEYHWLGQGEHTDYPKL